MTPDAAAVEAIALLRSAPPRQMIADERYWVWRKHVEEFLARVDDPARP